MLDERKEQRHFTRGCLLISMTFYQNLDSIFITFPGLEKMEFHDLSKFFMTGYTLVKYTEKNILKTLSESGSETSLRRTEPHVDITLCGNMIQTRYIVSELC